MDPLLGELRRSQIGETKVCQLASLLLFDLAFMLSLVRYSTIDGNDSTSYCGII